MAYLKNEDHFVNFLKSVARETSTTSNDLLPIAFYVEHIYRDGFGDKYTWDLKNDHTLLVRGMTIDWLRTIHQEQQFCNVSPEGFTYTDAFFEEANELHDTPGVYSFWTKDDIPLYVGKSKDLGTRVQVSIKKCLSMNEPIYFRYAKTATQTDASIIEAYYIAQLKPMLNRIGKDDPVTAAAMPREVPPWSTPILCYEGVEIPLHQRVETYMRGLHEQ